MKQYFFLAAGRVSSVGTATGYGRDGPGNESRQGRDFVCPPGQTSARLNVKTVNLLCFM